MSNVEICGVVKDRIKSMQGIDFEWLRRHSDNCTTCKQISSIVSVVVDEVVSPLTVEITERKGGE